MSILSRPLVADTASRVFAAVVNPAPKPGVRFPDIAGRTTEATIATRHGTVAATIYHPNATPAGVYVNVHGGGFVVGHREQDDPWCRYLAANANVVVINTDYALAPHERFPVPVEQIYDVLLWAAAQEREWDGSRLCVGGQSAGGNLVGGRVTDGARKRRTANRVASAALRTAGPCNSHRRQGLTLRTRALC